MSNVCSVDPLCQPTNRHDGVWRRPHVFQWTLCFLTTKDLPNTHKPTGPCVTFHRKKFFDSSLFVTWVLLLYCVHGVFFFFLNDLWMQNAHCNKPDVYTKYYPQIFCFFFMKDKNIFCSFIFSAYDLLEVTIRFLESIKIPTLNEM